MAQYSSRGSRTTPGEEFLLLMVGVIAVPTALAVVFSLATWHRVLDWMTTQHVLVTAADAPLLRIPGGNGVGLDQPRLAIVVAVLVMVLAITASTASRVIASRKEQDL